MHSDSINDHVTNLFRHESDRGCELAAFMRFRPLVIDRSPNTPGSGKLTATLCTLNDVDPTEFLHCSQTRRESKRTPNEG